VVSDHVPIQPLWKLRNFRSDAWLNRRRAALIVDIGVIPSATLIMRWNRTIPTHERGNQHLYSAVFAEPPEYPDVAQSALARPVMRSRCRLLTIHPKSLMANCFVFLFGGSRPHAVEPARSGRGHSISFLHFLSTDEQKRIAEEYIAQLDKAKVFRRLDLCNPRGLELATPS
jgi:hypothetical protein